MSGLETAGRSIEADLLRLLASEGLALEKKR